MDLEGAKDSKDELKFIEIEQLTVSRGVAEFALDDRNVDAVA